MSNPQRAPIPLTTTLGAPSAGGGCQRAPHADLQGADACLPARQTRAAHDFVPSPQAARGAFKSTTPDDLLLAVLRATAVQSGVAPSEVQDIAVGNVQLSGAYAGPARMSMLRAGFPASVPLYTVNRQCSSGLQAVANIAASIRSGSISTGIAAGVESMSFGGAVGGGEHSPP